MNEPTHPASFAADQSEGFSIRTNPPSVIIHAAETDQTPNQALRFFLETSLGVIATCTRWNPSDTVVDILKGSPAVHLIDCLGCHQGAVESRLHRFDALTFMENKIVLFNIDSGCPTDKIAKRNEIWGVALKKFPINVMICFM